LAEDTAPGGDQPKRNIEQAGAKIKGAFEHWQLTRPRVLTHWPFASESEEHTMIVLGIILLIIGFIAHIAVLWTIGIIVLIIGLVLILMGRLGHAVGGRRHYF
jgi:Family of unknown function (DUF6131)